METGKGLARAGRCPYARARGGVSTRACVYSTRSVRLFKVLKVCTVRRVPRAGPMHIWQKICPRQVPVIPVKHHIIVHKDVFINDRTKTFHRKKPYFIILDLIILVKSWADLCQNFRTPRV